MQRTLIYAPGDGLRHGGVLRATYAARAMHRAWCVLLTAAALGWATPVWAEDGAASRATPAAPRKLTTPLSLRVISGDHVARTGGATPVELRQADKLVVRVASQPPEERQITLLCQALGPAAPYNICGVDGGVCNPLHSWEKHRWTAWQAYAQGEYVGHERLAHVPEYRIRVDDQLDFIYRLTREEIPTPYKLNVGDEVNVESFTDAALNRNLIIQPDGTITLRLLGQVHATGRTVQQLRETLEEGYKKYYKVPSITVTPLKVNTKLEDLRASVDRRAGIGGQSQAVRVTPEGTIALPAIGSVFVQGLTLSELRQEVNARYWEEIGAIETVPVLVKRAPRYVYVLGEVFSPGRFELTGPTTLLQALSMAGSWRVGAHLRQVVVFRRGDDWRLLATMVNVDAALRGKQPNPPGEIWLDDSDVVIVPKCPIQQVDDFVELVFTRGIYGVFPMTATLNFLNPSTM